MAQSRGKKGPADRWKEIMFLYNAALRQINAKIEIMNDEFVERFNYSPIEHIKSRLKTPDSIVRKQKRVPSQNRQTKM